MKAGSSKLAGIVLGYGPAALLQGLIAFLAVPVLIRALGASSFALWAIIEPLIGLLAMAALLGASHGHLRALALLKALPEQVIRLQWRFGALPALTIALLGSAGIVWYLEVSGPLTFWALASVYLLCEAVFALLQAIARGQGDAMAYGAAIWLKFGLLGLALATISVAGLCFTLDGYLLGLILLDLLVIARISRRYRKRTPEPEAVPDYAGRSAFVAAVRYGLPVVMAAALNLIASNGDRYVVHALMPPDRLAGYVVMAKLAGALSFAAAPIALWWPAARYRHALDADGGAAFYTAATNVLLVYYLSVAACAWLAAPIVIGLYAPGVDSYDANTMLALLGAAVASAMVTPMNVGTLNEGKTHWTIWTIGGSAAFGLMLSVLLLPRIGYAGAAVGTVCAQLAALGLTHWVSQRIQYLRFDYRKPALVCLLFAGLMSLLIVTQPGLALSVGGLLAFVIVAACIAAPDARRMFA